MFGYKRYRSGKRSWGNRFGRPYKYRRWGSAARAYSSARSSKAGTKTETYNGQVNGYVTYTVGANEYRSDVQMFMPYFGATTIDGIARDTLVYHGGALNDRTFRLLCSQYDQVRLVSMTVKITPAVVSGIVSPIKLMSICDRKCVLEEMYPDSGQPQGIDGRMTAKEVENNPGVIVTEFNGNRVSPVVRYCRARDVQERTTYIDSTIEYDTDEISNPFYTMTNFDWKNKNAEFCPCFFTCLKSPVTTTTAQTYTYSYTVEYNFIFRNPKNNLDNFIATEVVSSSKSLRDMALRMMLANKDSEEKKESEKDVLSEEVVMKE